MKVTVVAAMHQPAPAKVTGKDTRRHESGYHNHPGQ